VVGYYAVGSELNPKGSKCTTIVVEGHTYAVVKVLGEGSARLAVALFGDYNNIYVAKPVGKLFDVINALAA
jgi:hypothetical protein